MCLLASSLVVSLDTIPLNASDYFNKLTSHFNSVFGSDNELLAPAQQLPVLPSAESKEDNPTGLTDKQHQNNSRELLKATADRGSLKPESRKQKRKLQIEEEVNSLLALINKAAFGADPERKTGRESVRSSTKITTRKGSETTAKSSRRAMTNRYIESKANAINKISQHVISLNENEVTRLKKPFAPSPSKKKSKSKIVVKKILHKDLTNRENDYSQLIINSYTTKDWDNYNLDLKKSVYHQKLNDAVAKLTKKAELDDIDLDNIAVTQDDVLSYLKKLTGLKENNRAFVSAETSLTEQRKELIQRLLDLLKANPILLTEFNPVAAKKTQCDPTLVSTLDDLLKKITQNPAQQEVRHDAVKSEEYREIRASAHKKVLQAKNSVRKFNQPTNLTALNASNPIAIQSTQLPIILQSPGLELPNYTLPLAPTMPPELSPFALGLPPLPMMSTGPAFFQPMMPQNNTANPSEPNVDFYYHYFPASYVKNLATKKYLNELNSMIKRIPISSDNLELQQDIVHHDPTDELANNNNIKATELKIIKKQEDPALIKNSKNNGSPKDDQLELEEEVAARDGTSLSEKYPVIDKIFEKNSITSIDIKYALNKSEENPKHQFKVQAKNPFI